MEKAIDRSKDSSTGRSLDRDSIQRAVDNFFATRLTNDPDKVFALFASDATVRMAGAESASDIAHRTANQEELKASVTKLVTAWQWSRVDISSTLIEGNSAAVRYDLTTEHVATGLVLDAESMDQFYFDEDLLITEMIEFVDTAKAEELERLASQA